MVKRALLAILFCVLGPPCSLDAQPVPEVKFGELTQKFTRNLQLLGSFSTDPDIVKMVQVVVAKAEDLKYYNNLKNADERRSRIIKQIDAMLHREGIEQSDQRKLAKLQEELRALDPDGTFNTARGEMQRAVGEFQSLLGKVHAPDERSQDVIRLIRQHLSYYQQCLSKMPN